MKNLSENLVKPKEENSLKKDNVDVPVGLEGEVNPQVRQDFLKEVRSLQEKHKVATDLVINGMKHPFNNEDLEKYSTMAEESVMQMLAQSPNEKVIVLQSDLMIKENLTGKFSDKVSKIRQDSQTTSTTNKPSNKS